MPEIRYGHLYGPMYRALSNGVSDTVAAPLDDGTGMVLHIDSAGGPGGEPSWIFQYSLHIAGRRFRLPSGYTTVSPSQFDAPDVLLRHVLQGLPIARKEAIGYLISAIEEAKGPAHVGTGTDFERYARMALSSCLRYVELDD